MQNACWESHTGCERNPECRCDRTELAQIFRSANLELSQKEFDVRSASLASNRSACCWSDTNGVGVSNHACADGRRQVRHEQRRQSRPGGAREADGHRYGRPRSHGARAEAGAELSGIHRCQRQRWRGARTAAPSAQMGGTAEHGPARGTRGHCPKCAVPRSPPARARAGRRCSLCRR